MKSQIRVLSGSKTLRKTCLIFILAGSLCGIAWLFWTQELKYLSPTTIPPNYEDIRPGTPLTLALLLDSARQKPVFLHFFNPDCPCSKFNISHFKELVKTYGQQLDFAVVAMVPGRKYNAEQIQDKFGLDLPVTFDTTLAAACGVYSTPQAVIIDNKKLFFRGNYNKSRYCSDPATDFARMAIDSLLLHKNNLPFGPLAYKAYGCELPKCSIKP